MVENSDHGLEAMCSCTDEEDIIGIAYHAGEGGANPGAKRRRLDFIQKIIEEEVE